MPTPAPADRSQPASLLFSDEGPGELPDAVQPDFPSLSPFRDDRPLETEEPARDAGNAGTTMVPVPAPDVLLEGNEAGGRLPPVAGEAIYDEPVLPAHCGFCCCPAWYAKFDAFAVNRVTEDGITLSGQD